MDDDTKKVLMIGVPVGLAIVAAVAYFATRPAAENGPSGDCQEGAMLYETCPDGSQIVTYQCINGAWVPTGNQCAAPPPPGCQDGYVLYEQCPDGSQIITHQCINGQWVPTGNQCPEPPGACPPGSLPHMYHCGDGSKVPLKSCVGGQWVPGTQPCAGYPPYPPMPGEPCAEGEHASYCSYDDSGFNKQYLCIYGRWFPTHGWTDRSHPYETCNIGTTDYMHLYYKANYQGNIGVIIKYWHKINNRIESTSYTFIWTYQYLIEVLEDWIAEGRINGLQYQNAVLQAANMGFS